MLIVNNTIISRVITNKTGNNCVNVDVVKGGQTYHVFRCLVTITLTQHSSTIYLQQVIIDYKKAHPESAQAVNFKIINNLVQPNVVTGNLAGMTVEFVNGGQIEANTQSGVALTISSRLKITNTGHIRGGGGHGATGGAGGNSSNRSHRVLVHTWSHMKFWMAGQQQQGWKYMYDVIHHQIHITNPAGGVSTYPYLHGLGAVRHHVIRVLDTNVNVTQSVGTNGQHGFDIPGGSAYKNIVVTGFANNATHGVGGVGGHGQYYGHPAVAGAPTWTHKAGAGHRTAYKGKWYYGWKSGDGGRGGTGGSWGRAGGGGSAGAGAQSGHGNKGHPQLGNQGKSGDAVHGARFTKGTGSAFGNVNGHVIQ